MAARLKVYRTQIGFYDAVVAAPNQKAARAAWDVREDLFASGAAAATDEPAAVEAALARPGVVLRRPVGADGAFVEDPALPAAPAGRPKRAVAKPPPKPQPKPAGKSKPSPKPKPEPDRSALTAAERALAAVTAAEAAALAELEAERAALEARLSAVRDDFRTRRREAEARLTAARTAFRKSAGAP